MEVRTVVINAYGLCVWLMRKAAAELFVRVFVCRKARLPAFGQPVDA